MSTAAAPVSDHKVLIRRVPLFADLSDAELEELCAAATRIGVAAGELVFSEGDVGDTVYIILSGALEVTKRDGDRSLTLATRRPGEVLGEMSLLAQAPRSASVRALVAAELLVIGPEAVRRLLASRPAVATTLLRTVAARLRSTEASLIQSDKLAALGTLAAGLAHELNNPAAAIQRSTAYLNEAFEAWRHRTVELSALNFSADERDTLARLEHGIAECRSSRQSDAAARKAEAALVSRLEALAVPQAWEVGPAMAAYGWTAERLEQVRTTFSPEHTRSVLQWLGAALEAQKLIDEIQGAATAISDIVRAVKSYAYLDQAPVQNVDVEASVADTLMILKHKLKQGIDVVCTFERDLPRIEAYAGELNQVWTNIIDNAIQAMEGRGRLDISGSRLGDEVEVRIADDGPGIPAEIAGRIFEPFFTTKAQGVGTGLGLHIAYNIVVNRHRGRLSFTTRPGRTEFRVVLPLRLGAEPSADDVGSGR